MPPLDAVTFRAGMERLSAAFDRELTDARLTVFWESLSDLDSREYARAIESVLVGDKEHPVPSRLRQLAREATGSARAAGAEVFDRLLIHAPRYDARFGDYWAIEDVEAKFGAVGRAAFVAAGGRNAFQSRTDRDLPFLRKAFLDAYEAARTADAKGTLERVPLPAGPETALGKLAAQVAAQKAFPGRASGRDRQLPRGDTPEAA